MKKVTVIGGSGFLGSYISDELTKRGYDVLIADKQHSVYLKNPPPVSFEDAMRTLTLLHGIYRSAELGTWVNLSENNQSVRLGRPNKDLSALYLAPEPKI